MFIIKVVATATEQNKNFKGEVQTTYFGKQEKSLSREEFLVKYWVENYGFKTKAAACRALKSLKETSDWFDEKFGDWTHEYSIVEIG